MSRTINWGVIFAHAGVNHQLFRFLTFTVAMPQPLLYSDPTIFNQNT